MKKKTPMTIEEAMKDDFVHPDEAHDQERINSMTDEELAASDRFLLETLDDVEITDADREENIRLGRERLEVEKKPQVEGDTPDKIGDVHDIKDLQKVRQEIEQINSGKKVA